MSNVVEFLTNERLKLVSKLDVVLHGHIQWPAVNASVDNRYVYGGMEEQRRLHSSVWRVSLVNCNDYVSKWT